MKKNFDEKYAEGLYNSKKYDRYFKYCLEFAEQGNARAEYYVAQCYSKKISVTYDKDKVLEWYERSAKHGDAMAQLYLGKHYMVGTSGEKKPELAVEWFIKSANQNNAEAQFSLGCCFASGTGVAKDYVQAIKLWMKSADQGYALAISKVNSLPFDINYAFGFYQGKKYKELLGYCLKFAGRGLPEAQDMVGALYEIGEVTQKDLVKAAKWYKEAADQGFERSQLSIGWYYGHILRDEEKARMLYTKYAQQGSKMAQYIIDTYFTEFSLSSNIYRSYLSSSAEAFNKMIDAIFDIDYSLRLHKENRLKERFEYCLIFAERGEAEAQNMVGVYYEEGSGIEANITESLKWYKMAADQDFDRSQYYLGDYYRNAEKNMEEAIKWYKKAADNGYEAAQNILYTRFNLPQYRSNKVQSKQPEIDSNQPKSQYSQSTDEHDMDEMLRKSNRNFESSSSVAIDSDRVKTDDNNVDEGNPSAPETVRSTDQTDGLPQSIGFAVNSDEDKLDELLEKFGRIRDFKLGRSHQKSSNQFKTKDDYESEELAKQSHNNDVRLNQSETVPETEQTSIIMPQQKNCEQAENVSLGYDSDEEISSKDTAEVSDRISKNGIESGMDEIKSDLAFLKKEVSDIKKETIETNINTRIIIAQVEDLSDYVKNTMTQEIQQIRKDVIITNANNKSFGKRFKEFSDKVISKMQLRLKSESKEVLFESEEILKKYFGEDVWNKFTHKTKKSLKSARVLWAKCRELDSEAEFDYSGVVICAAAALENELRKYFFDGFKLYLKGKNIKYDKWPERLIYYTRDLGKSESTRFEIGTMPFLFGQISKIDNDIVINDNPILEIWREEYLSSIMKDKFGQEKFSDCFIKKILPIDEENKAKVQKSKNIERPVYEEDSIMAQLEHIRVKFRNNAAHTGILKQSEAEECCIRIMGKFEADENNNFRSILKQIFDLFDLLK